MAYLTPRLHRRSALRHIHQLDVSALNLKIEISRAPIDACEQCGGRKQPKDPHHNHDSFTTGRQVQPAIERFDRLHSSKTIKGLHDKDCKCRDDDIDQRRWNKPLPTDVHQLIVTKTREGPAQPEIEVKNERRLHQEDEDADEHEQVVMSGSFESINKREIPAAE